MPIKACVFIAVSLDGFISRPDGSIDWLNQANTLIPEGEDLGFRDFLERMDALIMGRNTFEQALTLGDWPYGDKKVIVMTHRGVTIPEALGENVITFPGRSFRLLLSSFCMFCLFPCICLGLLGIGHLFHIIIDQFFEPRFAILALIRCH